MADQSDMSAIQWIKDEITSEVVIYGSRYSLYKSSKYMLDAMEDDRRKENCELYRKLDLNIAAYLMENPNLIISAKPWTPDDDTDLAEYLQRISVQSDMDLQGKALLKYNAKVLNRIARNQDVITTYIPLRDVNARLWARQGGAGEYGDTVTKSGISYELWKSVAPTKEVEPISYETVRKIADRDIQKYEYLSRTEATHDGR